MKTNACDACQQAHKKCLFFVQPFQPCGQRDSLPRSPLEDSLVVNNEESIPEWEWMPGPQTGRWEQFRTIILVPSSINLSTPLLGHHPMVASLFYQSKVIIRPMKDGDGKRTFKLGPIVTHGIQRPKDILFSSLIYFSSRNHTEFFPLCIKQNQPNPLQQDSPIPSLPCEQTSRQPTPGPSGTQWLEDLFHHKKPKNRLLISTLNSSELTITPFVEPSQPDEPPIPGPSQSSEPHEDASTCES
ncbi:hypothetical protein O181_025394 [Austropuccinia psidii MF-1]|uniref:Uncharacterized protein n=1 Tax=Austropuccinia psidii MF-1 TaxID=1389203 RepID=A0A9Q3H0L1_9BASI|nr:hypothetical protein [Austropuccinia psidii MF-1]